MNFEQFSKLLSHRLARSLLMGLVTALIATLFPRKPKAEMTEEERLADARSREIEKRMKKVNKLTRRMRF